MKYLNKLFFMFALFLAFFALPVVAIPISSVDDVHYQILSLKNINLPVSSEIDSKSVATLQYLLKQIDDANFVLNGVRVTDYASEAGAKTIPVTTTKTTKDVNDLVKEYEWFTVTVTDVKSFSFQLSAAGKFFIDWGDGTIDKIDKTAYDQTYMHNYSNVGTYKVRITGKATGYVSEALTTQAAISYLYSTNKTKITAIEGSLGKIFSTLADGANPSFYSTFSGCSGITSAIPEDLFVDITGKARSGMFFLHISGV